MSDLKTQVATALHQALDEMNTYINLNGEIKRSSSIIKGWHTYDNYTWELIMSGAQVLNDQRLIDLPDWVIKDIDLLLNHLSEHSAHHSNILYPTPKDTNSLPHAITHADLTKYPRSIKTRTFRTMMNIREALCRALDIDLPNCDSSQGLLDPKPKDLLFEF
jgi:hypothetical protein